MTAIWNVDWLNANSQRNYPLSEGAAGYDTTGSFELPADFLVDLALTVPAAADIHPEKFHLLTLAVFADGVVLTVGYDGEPAAIASINRQTHALNTGYRLLGQGSVFFDVTGAVVIGKLESLLQLPGGMYTFDLAGGRIETTCIRPDLRGVSSLVVVNGEDESPPIYGDIVLVAGSNVRLVASPQTGSIRIDSTLVAEDLTELGPCDNPALLKPCIKSINGVTPDANGNLVIEGDDCIRQELDTAGHKIVFSDQCSSPCCGCDELTVIRTDLSTLYAQLSDLNAAVNRADAVVTQAVNSLLASKLNTCQA